MKRQFVYSSLLLVAFGLWPVLAQAGPPTLHVVQDRAYRLGVFLVVDALVENTSSTPRGTAPLPCRFPRISVPGFKNSGVGRKIG